MLGTDKIRKLLFEALHSRSEDVLGGGGDFVERAIDLPGDRLVLRHQVDEGNYSCHLSRAGIPTTIVSGATSRVTTSPAPTRARAPIRTPPRTIAPAPSEAPRSTTVRRRVQSVSLLVTPSSVVARANLSLTNRTRRPSETSASISTPLQMNEWLEILHASPIEAPRCTSTNDPIRLRLPMRHR